MLQCAQATEEDAEGFVNIPLTSEEVEAVLMLKETEPQIYRASLRSKGEVNVAKIAEKFGGGGHRNAAGCALHGDWDEVEQMVMNLLVEAVSKAKDKYAEVEDLDLLAA
jgi:phosphoesterase RecJ-like protein